MMKTVIQFGTGTAANFGKPAAGKTGTTDDYKDAYFMGYTPDVVCGVWVGNDDNSKGSLTGGTVPALIWKDVMKVATEPFGDHDFDYPQVVLEPFKADSVKIIAPSDAKKAFDKKDGDQPDDTPFLDIPKVDIPKININLPSFRKTEPVQSQQPIAIPQPAPAIKAPPAPVPVKTESIDVPKSNTIEINANNMEKNINE